MIHRFTLASVALILALVWSLGASAHCQIPCGIYDDELRAQLIAEHIGTIDRSMGMIQELSAAAQPDHNQLSRWISNKDQHADELVHIVTYYFMAQRLKPTDLQDPQKKARYIEQLTLLHGMMVHAMKAKQTTDHEHIEELRDLLGRFEVSYFGHAIEH